MTNYEYEILKLIPGDTPKKKYDTIVRINAFLEMIATPRRGFPEENWTIQDAYDYINSNDLIAYP